MVTRWRWIALSIGTVAVITRAAIFFGNSIAIAFENDDPSESLGSTSDGILRNGKRLPTSGPNFRAYSRLAATLGRNAVHSEVRQVVLDAYSRLESQGLGHRFVYGETGWPSGGSFRPHRTHQNGLSVDFMVPVLDGNGKPVPFLSSVFNRFGYDLEFDDQGRSEEIRIDFAAISAHLAAIRDAARVRGLSVQRVIFAPEYRDRLLDPQTGEPLEEQLPFLPGRAWVRHDEHYHVDFALPPK
jgi:penicillin-insensitive murein endopeptidase